MKEYKPGEWVKAELMFGHDQELKDVSVIYRNPEADSRLVVLRPESWETEPKEGVPGYPNFVSTVVLRAQVDTADLHAPGTYELAEIVFETFSGKQLGNIPLDSAQAFTFKVVEPETPPWVIRLSIT
jgi:hypothetical protein